MKNILILFLSLLILTSCSKRNTIDPLGEGCEPVVDAYAFALKAYDKDTNSVEKCMQVKVALSYVLDSCKILSDAQRLEYDRVLKDLKCGK
ncbi:MAG: hypothetical protein ACRCVT_16265 [Leadbetterella sp.]